MSMLAILVLFGLAVPLINFISNFLLGSWDEDIKDARRYYIENHLFLSILGLIIGFIPAILYWVYVISQL